MAKNKEPETAVLVRDLNAAREPRLRRPFAVLEKPTTAREPLRRPQANSGQITTTGQEQAKLKALELENAELKVEIRLLRQRLAAVAAGFGLAMAEEEQCGQA